MAHDREACPFCGIACGLALTPGAQTGFVNTVKRHRLDLPEISYHCFDEGQIGFRRRSHAFKPA